MKVCSRCNTEKPLDDFHIQRSALDGYGGYCKPCAAEYGRERRSNPNVTLRNRALLKEWNAARPDYRRTQKHRLYHSAKAEDPAWPRVKTQLAKHHLTLDQYAALEERSDWACLICGSDEALVIDHDHTCCPGNGSCGQCVRGFLCGGCNLGLGAFADNPQRLRNAVTYLEQE